MKSSSDDDRPPAEPGELREEKRRRLEDLVDVYEKILAVTASTDLRSLVHCFEEAEEITGSLRDLDERIRDASPAELPEAPSTELDAVENRVRALNRRITDEIQKQLDQVKGELQKVRSLKKAVSHYRPYEETVGRRIDWQG